MQDRQQAAAETDDETAYVDGGDGHEVGGVNPIFSVDNPKVREAATRMAVTTAWTRTLLIKPFLRHKNANFFIIEYWRKRRLAGRGHLAGSVTRSQGIAAN